MPAALRTSAFISTALMSLVILGAQEKWKELTDKAHGMTKQHWWNDDTGELGIPNTFFSEILYEGGRKQLIQDLGSYTWNARILKITWVLKKKQLAFPKGSRF